MERENRIAWFQRLASAMKAFQPKVFDLVLQADVDRASFQRMRQASANYLRACLAQDAGLSDDALLESLDDIMPQLANRTPNGVVLPKREVAREFNEFHRTVADWFKSLGMDDSVDTMFCPPTLRIMAGKGDPKMGDRPYATSKMHADVWAGDPGDGVNVVITLSGDAERTTVDFHEPPADFEKGWLRHLRDYGEGAEYVSNTPRYDVDPKIGSAVFFDCIVPHKTVRKDGKSRATIQFNLRRKLSVSARDQIESRCDRGKLVNFIPLKEWYEFGSKRFMAFSETLADARKGVFTEQPYSKSFYQIVDHL